MKDEPKGPVPAAAPAHAPAPAAPKSKAPGGTVAYRIKAPMYRESVYLEAGAVIAVPADEKPSLTWKRTSATPAHVFQPLTKPKPVEEEPEE